MERWSRHHSALFRDLRRRLWEQQRYHHSAARHSARYRHAFRHFGDHHHANSDVFLGAAAPTPDPSAHIDCEMTRANGPSPAVSERGHLKVHIRLILLDDPIRLWYSTFWVQLQQIPVLACAHLPLVTRANMHNLGAI